MQITHPKASREQEDIWDYWNHHLDELQAEKYINQISVIFPVISHNWPELKHIRTLPV